MTKSVKTIKGSHPKDFYFEVEFDGVEHDGFDALLSTKDDRFFLVRRSSAGDHPTRAELARARGVTMKEALDWYCCVLEKQEGGCSGDAWGLLKTVLAAL